MTRRSDAPPAPLPPPPGLFPGAAGRFLLPGRTGRSVVAAALLGMGVAGCGGGEPGAPSGTKVPVWEAVEDLRVGSVDDPATSLTWFRDLEVGADGRIYLLHPMEQVGRIIERDGTIAGTFGGRGGGPGEFQNAIQMGWRADSLWVLDANGYRFSFFTPDGEFLTSFQVPFRMDEDPRAEQPPRASGLLPDGRVWGSPPAFSRQIARGDLTHHTLLFLSREGEVGDTIARIPFGLSVWEISDPENPGGGGMYTTQPFADGPLWAFTKDGTGLVVVERPAPAEAGRASFRVTRLTLDGDTVWSRTLEREAVPARDEEVDSILTLWAERMKQAPPWAGQTLPTLRSWADASLVRRAYRPAVDELLTGRDGTVWLREADADAGRQTWLVLDGNGTPLGRVALPERLRVLEADRSHVWGGDRDELDVAYAVRYALSR